MAEELENDHWAYFGDGNAAQILESRDYLKESGVKFVKFMFIPSKRIEKMFDLEADQDKITRIIVKEYKATEVLFLEHGITRTRVWIKPDFDGKATPASRETQALGETINDTEKLLRSAEAAKNRSYFELEKERQHQLEALKQKTDMVREVARARGKVESDSDQGGESYDAD